MEYNKITIEECYQYYCTSKVACICDGDKKEVSLVEE